MKISFKEISYFSFRSVGFNLTWYKGYKVLVIDVYLGKYKLYVEFGKWNRQQDGSKS